MEILDRFARFVVETKLKDIPAETVQFAKELALKTTASMLAGSMLAPSKRLIKYVKQRRGPPEVGVVGCGFRAAVEDAALADGFFAHASELEDDQYPGPTSDITIFPVVFPLAEKLKLSGKQMLEASLVGFEVQNRVSMFTQPRTAEIGILPLSFYGYLGAAAATARAFELNVEETARALGHAFTQSAGYYVELGTDAHYLDSAYCCRNAITTAMLVKKGLTSSLNFEQWLKTLLGTDGVDLSKITENLGKPPFFIHNTWVKKYPCCFMVHRQIDALFELIEEHRFSYRQVEHVDLDVGPGDASVCNRPEPENGESAKFSYQHALTAVMLEGKVEMNAFTDAKVADPLFARARSKVKVIVHPEWGPGTQVGIARVTVSLKNGRRLAREMEQPLGAPKRPLSTDQIIGIYKKYVRATLSDKQMKRTMKMVLDLEKVKDTIELMNTLTFAQTTG